MSTVTYQFYPYDKYLQQQRAMSLSQFEHFMWFEIPEELALTCELYKVEELKPTLQIIEDYQGYIQREGRNRWLQFLGDFFNKSAGLHSYKFTFVDTISEELIPLFFAYTFQDDNPSRPYIYMRPRSRIQVEREFLTMDDGEPYERIL